MKLTGSQIDWNLVSAELEITNGHAARMRYSRFKAQMEGRAPSERKPRDPNRSPRTPKAKRVKTDPGTKKENGEQSSINKVKLEPGLHDAMGGEAPDTRISTPQSQAERENGGISMAGVSDEDAVHEPELLTSVAGESQLRIKSEPQDEYTNKANLTDKGDSQDSIDSDMFGLADLHDHGHSQASFAGVQERQAEEMSFSQPEAHGSFHRHHNEPTHLYSMHSMMGDMQEQYSHMVPTQEVRESGVYMSPQGSFVVPPAGHMYGGVHPRTTQMGDSTRMVEPSQLSSQLPRSKLAESWNDAY
jgi:hypothetical protein